MAHGHNHPTGNIGFSPVLITMFAPLAFVEKAWRAALAGFILTIVVLLIWAWRCDTKDRARARKERLEREEREARGF